MIELILGGARSGKSRLAEHRAAALGKQVVYIATAQNLDGEMASRILHHQSRRPSQWATLEEPVALSKALQQHNQPDNVILVDCLTLWISNLLCLPPGPDQSIHQTDIFTQQKSALIAQLQQQQSDVILVSNETGMGVIPMGELTRRFVDESGWLHQELAQIADQVTLVVAGLPHQLKPQSSLTSTTLTP
jgi:adenosylcobinamide kinase/adenosylcobinamide-phosphate guanylyltransferase